MLSCIFFLYVVLLLLCSSDDTFSFARDTLTLDHPLIDDVSEGLVSAGKKFELGFFTTGTGSSNGRYVGIWYHKLTPKTVVWIANRGKPVPHNAVGVFAITNGNLFLLDNVTRDLRDSYFSTDVKTSSSTKVMAKIIDSGNLVLSDGDQLGENTLWQSFQNPTDTFIPGMRMDLSLQLTSSIGDDDPGIGKYVFKLIQRNQERVRSVSYVFKIDFIVSEDNTRTYWRTEGPGKFSRSVEMPAVITYLLFNFSKSPVPSGSNFNTDVKTVGFMLNITSPPRFNYTHARLVMTPSGKLQLSTWNEEKQEWVPYQSTVPKDQCSVLNACGNFGSCNINNVPEVCKCLPGFKPQSLDNWNSGDFSNGCASDSQICEETGDRDTFLSLKMMKVGDPDTEIIAHNETECRDMCLKNCCQAYSYSLRNDSRRDFSTDSLCSIWYKELNNLQEEYGIDDTIAVRVDLSDIESTVRDCEPCGTTLIPYPLSTGVGCGDPTYYRFKCDTFTGQLSFVGSNDFIFRVVSINRSSQMFFIQGLDSMNMDVDNCNSTNGVLMNLASPFKVRNWCRGDRGNFSSDSSTSPNVIEIGWESPLEPICTKLEDCSGWPHSTCSPARDGEKRCLCNTNYQWKDLNCSQEGNLQELPPKSSRKGMPLSLVVVAVCVSGTFLACIIVFYAWRRKMTKRRDQIRRPQLDSERRVKELIDTSEFKEEDDTGIDVPFFDLQSILDATDNFSIANKLGQGGYGPVYKGILPGGQEIAVKRLSRVSGQGMQEFKNEVVLIAKLQHRNLVRLRGYCMKGEEKILLYEYMPNKSLDSFIFDHTQSVFLNWDMRFNIILGVARGLLYLHQDSRLRIIHRDMKTSNILLDEEMTPKISDFGLARIVGGKETEANTNTVVGTYGYMSPEYALDGTFSVKSDVFSFGVVLLEIVSGKKNTGFYQSKQNFSLLAYAWQLWTEDKVLDLMDKSLEESCNTSEFIKCVNVALLCIQEDPVDRPTMSNVITLLDSEATITATPKQPAFFLKRGNSSTASSSTKPEMISEITTLEGR